jgi:hypothetical protein
MAVTTALPALRYELRHLGAVLVLDPEDAYARDRGVRGRHPRPVGPLTYRLVAQMTDDGRQDLAVPPELAVERTASGYDLFLGRELLPGGRRRRLPLPDGTYVLRVESPLYQPTERDDIDLPASGPYLFELRPGYAYPFPTETLPGGRGPTLLRGTYRTPDGSGISGATVVAPDHSDPCLTDDTGQWVLVLPDTEPTGQVTVRFIQGDTVEEATGVAVVGGGQASLAVPALRGRVLARGVGIARATVSVAGHPGQSSTGDDGGWSYHFPPSLVQDVVSVTARLPDGRDQTHTGIQIHARATAEAPDFTF